MKKLTLVFICLLLVTACTAETITPSVFWKNQIVFPDDPFCASPTSDNDPGWVKFTILALGGYDPNLVYYQDCNKYVLHYDFATELLDPFVGISAAEFYQVTLHQQGQQAILGTVIISPYQDIGEYGIQFIRDDPYSREQIADMFGLVKAGISADPNVQAFYFPTYEQLAAAEANRDWFESQGIVISSTARWAEGNVCYSQGWALGELKFFGGDEIEAAYQNGLLEPNDILLTDYVPAEIGFVSGIISLSPSVPSSHVAILANTFNVPFVHLALVEDANNAQQLVGRTVLLSVKDTDGVCNVGLRDVEDVLTQEDIDTILALKEPPTLDISPMAGYGAYSTDTNGLLPGDIQYFGGKAANFGMLREAIGDNSPVAVAFSFDLWNEFLDQTITGGSTLREEISDRLSAYNSYPPFDMAALSAQLESIREGLFKNTNVTSFTQAQKDAIITVLQDPQYGFDMNKKIRFRSSTNVEDSNQFTGAGLYSSYSGCLADDLDGDDNGPCLCDHNKAKERGVFRAIRRVFASFYNDNAFLERLRHDVNEAEVGMALLVHHSFPDEIELANGVATLQKEDSDPNIHIILVTQDGATSVANPEPGCIPEEVSVYVSSSGSIYPTLVRSSNLVPLGDTVMQWRDDYNDLSRLLVMAADRFEQVTGKTEYILDFEYKKVATGGAAMPSGGLVIKQIRQIPSTGDIPTATTPFLINEPVEYCTFQGWSSDLFANHRLKSRWRLETKNLWLTPANLEDSFYANVHLEYAAEGRIRTITGKPSLWPFAYYALDETPPPPWFYYPYTIDGWTLHHLANSRVYSLYTYNVHTQVSPTASPLVTLSDFSVWPGSGVGLSVEYAQPVPSRPSWPDFSTTTITDHIRLCPCPQPEGGGLLQQRSFDGPNDVSITTSFYWPSEPNGPTAGYTAPLKRWVETVIEGYTTEPIVLHSYYSQTYKPEYKNSGEHFLFEPQLEPGISQDILDQLRAKDIRLIYTATGGDITTYGFEQQLFIPGDFEPDGDVDFVDLAKLAERWLDTVCDACGGADLTGDGQVNTYDLLELAENWLAGL